MYNAHTLPGVRLYRVWGDDTLPPFIDPPAGTRVFVCYSPSLRQWVMSMTHIDWRYDALVSTSNFRLDAAMLPVDEEPDAPSYYLNRLRSSSTSK
jgi:hypothetical protein